MKKIILSLALVTGLTTASIAQDAMVAGPQKNKQKKDQTPEGRAKHAANWAGKQLTLTATQKSDWEIAALKRNMANQPFHEKLKGATTPEERIDLNNQIKTNKDAFDATVNGFLSPEQKTKLETIKSQKRDAHRAKVKAGKAKTDALEEDIEG